VVITATTARDPVVLGKWLQPGTHVNAIGANMANRRELDESALARASLIAVDSLGSYEGSAFRIWAKAFLLLRPFSGKFTSPLLPSPES